MIEDNLGGRRAGDFTMGQHAAQIAILLAGQTLMQRDINEIKDILAQRRGERRATWTAVTAVSSAVSLAVGIAVKVFTS